MVTQTEIILYKNGQIPLEGGLSGAWHWPGVAFSASQAWMYFNEDLCLKHARWVLAWNPNADASPTGVRLVMADSGPSNVQVLEQFIQANRRTPMVSAVDITHKFNILNTNNIPKSIAMQTVGTGALKALVYSSVIECVWG